MRDAFRIDAAEHEVWLARTADGGHALHALGQVVPVAMALDASGTGTLTVGTTRLPVTIATRGDDVFVHLDGAAWRLSHRHPLLRAAADAHAGADDEIRAPMPGTAVSVAVSAGDRVSRGATLMVMESMKLETTITADRDATIAQVHVAAGRTFDRDALLVTLAPPEVA